MIDIIFRNRINLPYIFCWNMVNTHSTLAYVVLIIHSRVLHRGGVHITFQVDLSLCP